MKRQATFTNAVLGGADEEYRYLLTRKWDPATRSLAFVMLNPSTADATIDDPTIRRCVGFAQTHGFGGIVVANLYAYRSTHPAALALVSDPVGPDNDMHLRDVLENSQLVVAAWGAHAAYTTEERVARFHELVAETKANVVSLGITKSGAPRHPLYVRADQAFTDWPAK